MSFKFLKYGKNPTTFSIVVIIQTFDAADSNTFVLGPTEMELGQNKNVALRYSSSELSTHPANSTQGYLS